MISLMSKRIGKNLISIRMRKGHRVPVAFFVSAAQAQLLPDASAGKMFFAVPLSSIAIVPIDDASHSFTLRSCVISKVKLGPVFHHKVAKRRVYNKPANVRHSFTPKLIKTPTILNKVKRSWEE
ncbi:MAG: hypothetical protein OXC60_12730 [Litoreibacter sp.]|nr:hypothetical protein [Litoreibacter sp.]